MFGFKRLDDSGVLLSVTKWKLVGYLASGVVRWHDFQRLSNDEMAEIVDNPDFRYRMV